MGGSGGAAASCAPAAQSWGTAEPFMDTDEGLFAGVDGLGNAFVAAIPPTLANASDLPVRVFDGRTGSWQPTTRISRPLLYSRRGGMGVWRKESERDPVHCDPFNPSRNPALCVPRERLHIRQVDLANGGARLLPERSSEWCLGGADVALGLRGVAIVGCARRTGEISIQLLRNGELSAPVMLAPALPADPALFGFGVLEWRVAANKTGEMTVAWRERFANGEPHLNTGGTITTTSRVRAVQLDAQGRPGGPAATPLQSTVETDYTGVTKTREQGRHTYIRELAMDDAGNAIIVADGAPVGVGNYFGRTPNRGQSVQQRRRAWENPITLVSAGLPTLHFTDAVMDSAGNALMSYFTYATTGPTVPLAIKRFSGSQRVWASDFSETGGGLAMAVDPEGNVHSAWHHYNMGIFAGARSARDGDTWTRKGRLDPDLGSTSGPTVVAPQACRPFVFFVQGTKIMMATPRSGP